jgi:hypothetical protein
MSFGKPDPLSWAVVLVLISLLSMLAFVAFVSSLASLAGLPYASGFVPIDL